MKKAIMTLAMLLALAVLASALPLVASADQLYIIPDSNTRRLTWDELMEYKYDTLLYAFNEIYARHGYKFEYGSRCYNWFIQMPWYTPNENENSHDHSATYRQCSQLENDNRDLIVAVRRYMRENGITNPNGKGMPTPPKQVNSPRGFSYVNMKANQKYEVYSAPSYGAYRANNGKAAVSTNGAIYAYGYDNGWMLMLYEANHAGQYRVGYIDCARVKGNLPDLPQVNWERSTATLAEGANLTDDPALTGKTLVYLPAGSQVTYLTTMFNDMGWYYVETTIDGQQARGFLPEGSLIIDSDAAIDDAALTEGEG